MGKGKKRVRIALVLLAFLIGVPLLAYRSIVLFDRVLSAQDAVMVIAMNAGNLYEENPATTPADLDAMVLHLHRNSVINLQIDSGGKAVDPFGTRFRVEHEDRGAESVTKVTSAGPDGRFGTPDDIAYAHVSRR